MDFGDAIRYLKLGRKVARLGCNGQNMYLGLQVPDMNSSINLPYIYMCTTHRDVVPWVAYFSDRYVI